MGFSLIELMVAMALFMVVGTAAVSLFRTHAPLFATQQNQAGLNIGMRSAIAQMQLDVVNAGSGFYPGASMPFVPVGITIVNTAGAFDSLNVITTDNTMPAAHPSGNSLGTIPADTSVKDLWLYMAPPAPAPPPTAAQLTAWAANLTANLTATAKSNEFLLVQGGSTDFSSAGESSLNVTSGPKMTTLILTAVIGVEGNSIHVQHAPTTSAGVPTTLPDPFGVINVGDDAKCIQSFDPNQDYAIRLTGVTYTVDNSDPTDPKLVRTPLGGAVAGSPNVIAEQIVGFKVGAWSTTYSLPKKTGSDPTASGFYSFNSQPDYANDWTSIRAVRINLTGRTPPNSTPGNTVSTQMISVVINPRNLSM